MADEPGMIVARIWTCLVCGAAILAQLDEDPVWCASHTAEELREAAERLDKEVGNESKVIALYRAANLR